MPSSREYFEFILGQLSDMEGIAARPMMGEYILYFRGKIFGGIYDDRLLVKPVPAALEFMPDAALEYPYEKGSKMLLVDNVDDKEYLCALIEKMYPDLPERTKK